MNMDTGHEWLMQLVSSVLATSFLFGLVYLLNSLNLLFYLYYPRSISISLIDPGIDPFIMPICVGLLSILTIALSENTRKQPALYAVPILSLILSGGFLSSVLGGLVIVGKMFGYALLLALVANSIVLCIGNGRILGRSSKTPLILAAIYFLVYLIAIETASAVHYMIRAFDRSTLIGRPDANIELQFSYAAYELLPVLYVAFLFSWAWVPIARKLISGIRKPMWGATKLEGAITQGEGVGRFTILQDPRLFLVLAVGVFVGFYPYFQNPPWLVGTDAYWRYYNPLGRMNTVGGLAGFTVAMKEWHPASSAILYAAQLALGATPKFVVKYSPLVLIILLGLSTWWFLAHKSSSNFGLLVFLISIMSITTTVGMFASILSNWMALVAWMAFFAYATVAENRGFKAYDVLVLFAISTFVLAMHPWSWGVFAASVLVGAILFLLYERRKGLRGSAVLASVVAMDLLLALAILAFAKGGQLEGTMSALQMNTYALQHPDRILVFWDAVIWVTRVWSPFFSPLLVAVSIVGVFYINGSSSGLRRPLIFAWIFAAGIGSVLVSPVDFSPDPASNQSEIWRLLFLTPFQLTAPFGVAKLAQLPKRFESGVREHVSLRWIWLGSILGTGIVLPWIPSLGRLLVIPILLSAITALALRRVGDEKNQFLSNAILAFLILVGFNYATRGLSQLLFDPHNAPGA